MDLGLAGKRALVSGSTAGIGLAIAVGLAREGAEVIVNGRTDGRVAEAIKQIQAEVKGARVRGVAADVGSADGAAKMVREVPDVDVLVNNMGIFEPKAFEEIPDADWMRFWEVNVMSGVRLGRHYLAGMKRRGWGRIVFISSESGVQIPGEMVHYGVTKTAQLAVARGMAETCAGTGVTVNSVLPGPTRSEGVEGFVRDLAKSKGITESDVEREFFKEMRPTSLIKRFATVEEVANMVVYVSSERASATNGAALRVDGGVVRSIV